MNDSFFVSGSGTIPYGGQSITLPILTYVGKEGAKEAWDRILSNDPPLPLNPAGFVAPVFASGSETSSAKEMCDRHPDVELRDGYYCWECGDQVLIDMGR